MTSSDPEVEVNDLSRLGVTYKHITLTSFMWLTHEKGKITRATGGTFRLQGDTYIERVEYGLGSDYEVVRDAGMPFQLEIKGNRWHHHGKLANGTVIEEMWERLRPAKKVPTR